MWRQGVRSCCARGALALAGNGDVFAATGMVATLVCLGNRPGYFIRVDTPVGRGLGEIPRLAIGAGGVGAASLALRDTLRGVADDENAAVGRCSRCGEQEYTAQKR